MQWVRAQTALIKTLQKETSNPDAPLHNAQPSCGTSVAFQFKGTFPKHRKLNFSKCPQTIVVRFFLLCSCTTWPGMERCSLKILPERAATLFSRFFFFSSKHHTTTVHKLCGVGVWGVGDRVDGVQMSRWQETTPNGEVQTGIRSWCDLMITLKVSPLTFDTLWQSLPSKSKLILALPEKSSEGMNERGGGLPPLLCMSLIWTRIGKKCGAGFHSRAAVNGSAFLCPPPSTLEDQLRHCCEFERHLFEGRRLTNDTWAQAGTQNIEQPRLQFGYLWMNSGAMCGSVMPVDISRQPRDKETGRKDRLWSLKHVLTCDINRPLGVSGINKQKACIEVYPQASRPARNLPGNDGALH